MTDKDLRSHDDAAPQAHKEDEMKPFKKSVGRFAAAALVFVLALLLAASAAYSQRQRAGGTCSWPVSCYHGYVNLTISGRGSVGLSKGFVYPTTLRCIRSCTRKMRVYRTRGPRLAMTETPHKGWKFAGWSGFCKNKKQTCAIDLSQVTPAPPTGDRVATVSARFIR